jgi:hypothetical protein
VKNEDNQIAETNHTIEGIKASVGRNELFLVETKMPFSNDVVGIPLFPELISKSREFLGKGIWLSCPDDGML